ncbi:putative repeat protein (TIGR01451 family) [Aquimarina sp. MAR_2010_214]|uniref:DUF11 domain-containing protein n=1 Tax=Aquimarina sp. MAR_2010_214 TaxID=1250026 RepID=UPI000C705AD3|nr:DUF11 domain-containing protein [Aquimarina sp. MAR_2010_214]PKV51198.1 putative repeat protein (TIGR01451 family) [Aquimarina sp. MAR_2010_214]
MITIYWNNTRQRNFFKQLFTTGILIALLFMQYGCSDDDDTQAASTADLGITKTVNTTAPNVGSNITFTTTAINNGPDDATGVKVTDNLPSGYTFVSATASTGTYTNDAGIWSVGDLSNGANATLDITATVLATGDYANTATIAGEQTDTTTDNNSVTFTVTPTASTLKTDLDVTKTVNTTAPSVGNNITFTITATNNGPDDATGVKVTDNLPSGYTFVDATALTGTYANNTGIWSVGNLSNGASATLDITATILATGDYANTATITGEQTDATVSNNSATVTPTVSNPTADLGITKTVNIATPDVGNNIIFTLTATNKGPEDATGVKVTDNLPSGYTFVNATASTGTYTNSTGIWSIDNLSNGASVTLDITATVLATGNYTNTATVAGEQADTTTGNNSATSTITPTKIYIAGEALGGTDPDAILWKNGTATLLSPSTNNARANSIFVSGTDVYVTGIKNEFAVLWKNGSETSLSPSTSRAKGNSVYVSSGDVYVAGYQNDGVNAQARYWKNGVGTYLSYTITSTSSSVAEDITVVSGDVYVAGSAGVDAVYWRNGTRITLNTSAGSSFARAMAIKVIDNVVHVVGYEISPTGYSPRYWKNGVRTNLSGTGRAYSIAVANNGDVYIGGENQYWKNGSSTAISGKAESTMIFNNDVYMTGGTKYWKNGVETIFTNDNWTRGNSIFVTN